MRLKFLGRFDRITGWRGVRKGREVVRLGNVRHEEGLTDVYKS